MHKSVQEDLARQRQSSESPKGKKNTKKQKASQNNNSYDFYWSESITLYCKILQNVLHDKHRK